MKTTKTAQLFGFLAGFFVMATVSLFAGATFSRIKTWVNGEVLTASDLNAEFNNILNNLDPDGIDDYSVDTTEMRSTVDPYPAAAESLATSLEGEIERIRYQILELKKAIQTSNVTYWYQDLPTAGVFTIAGSSVGVNDTTPDYTLDLESGSLGTSGNITSDGNITTTGDDVDVSTHMAVAGDLSVTGTFSPTTLTVTSTVTFSGMTKVAAHLGSNFTANSGVINTFTDDVDTLGEMDIATFTATNTGNYLVCVSLVVSPGGTLTDFGVVGYKNGTTSALRMGFDTGPTMSPNGWADSACVLLPLVAGDTFSLTIVSGGSGTETLAAVNPNKISIIRIP